jgi:glycine cleavage system H protein
MASPPEDRILYKRHHFTTRLPVRFLYSPAHYWLREDAPGTWRVGLTGFATRMLGEIVEFEVEREAEHAVRPGEVVGWIEGFKAVADLFSVVEGSFCGTNPIARADFGLICKDPYGDGWLYEVNGTPDRAAIDVHGYISQLDATIDRMLERPWKNETLDAPPTAPKTPARAVEELGGEALGGDEPQSPRHAGFPGDQFAGDPTP